MTMLAGYPCSQSTCKRNHHQKLCRQAQKSPFHFSSPVSTIFLTAPKKMDRIRHSRMRSALQRKNTMIRLQQRQLEPYQVPSTKYPHMRREFLSYCLPQLFSSSYASISQTGNNARKKTFQRHRSELDGRQAVYRLLISSTESPVAFAMAAFRLLTARRAESGTSGRG